MTLTAAADGSALGNPGPTGWAWYMDDERWAAGGFPHGTNNIGELTAVLRLLEATREAGLADEPLRILCDSKYVIDSITSWMPGWKRRGWRKADGKPVKNVEIMRDLDAAMQGRTVTFEWVKGHAGHPLNEAADERANAAARAFQAKRAPQSGPGLAAATAPAPRAAAQASLFGDAQASLFTDAQDSPRAAAQTAPGPAADAQHRLLTAHRPGKRAELLHPDAHLVGEDGSLLSPARWDSTLEMLAARKAQVSSLDSCRIADLTLLVFTITAGEKHLRGTSVWRSAGTGGHPVLLQHQLQPLRV